MGVAVGISLLLWKRADIFVISYPLPVNCRHLNFATYPDIEQDHYCYCVFYGTENVLLPLKLCFYHVYLLITCNYTISAAILDFWLPVSYGSVTDSTIDTPVVTPHSFNTNVTKITFNIMRVNWRCTMNLNNCQPNAINIRQWEDQ